MKISVIGLGHVGSVAAAGLAQAGHHVLGVDIDPFRLDQLRSGQAPFYEPGLTRLVAAGIEAGNLRFSHRDDVDESLGEVAVITTGTPTMESGAIDLRQIRSALSWVVRRASLGIVVAMKSTVPPGTGRRIIDKELKGTGIGYVANPEFLREGRALQDWASPGRVVIGTELEDARSAQLIKKMHQGIESSFIITDITSAEMIKYANNAFLATKISFINEIASLCERVGASVDAVSEGLAMDARTGSRAFAGVGYGGSCFPKDIRALDHLALTSGVSVELLRAVINVNNRQRLLPLYAIRERFSGALPGLTVGVLGLAFKPETDDVREAPSVDLIKVLVDEGAQVQAYDPMANGAAREYLPAEVRLVEEPTEAADCAQALIVLTEWDQIVNADWETMARRMRPPKFVFDGRNALDSAKAIRLGFSYVGVGRGNVYPGGAAHPERDLTGN